MKELFSDIRGAVVSTLVLAVVCCGIYPLIVFGIAQAALHDQANGSLIVEKDGTVRGSALLGQNFSGEKYFHPRPSSAGNGYDAANSSGSNLGPTSQKLNDAIKERVEAYRKENGLKEFDSVPADAVSASGSGLDPHISLRNAELQVSRVAKARGLSEEQLRPLINRHTDKPDWGFLGEPGVNVLRLNLALDDHLASLSRTKPSLVIPDEEAAAFKLLAQKFTGPRYFQPNASRTQPSHSGTAEPRISAADARLQVKRIAAERNLGPDVETKLNALIERLTEPSPSRVVGEPEIKLLRLNLALDELEKNLKQ